MREPSVLLVAMPWHTLGLPSIQLGILWSVLEQAGIATEVRSLMLSFMEHCLTETAARPEGERVELADYAMVADQNFPLGLGDWIFAVPPFRDAPDRDAQDTILDMRYFRDVLPRLREARYDLSLYYETKANLRREQVRLLREAGVNLLQPGLESLSTPILLLMRKGVTAFQNVRLLKWCAEYGIHVLWNVIYGFPGESSEEYARMAGLVPSLTHLVPPVLCRLALHRFSPYHDRPAEFGLEVLGPLPWYRLVYPADDTTLAALAYNFDYRHADGRDPETYVGPLREAIEAWQASHAASYRALRYRRGPGFLVVHDRRPSLEAADYSFGEREARLFLACEDGATAAEARGAGRGGDDGPRRGRRPGVPGRDGGLPAHVRGGRSVPGAGPAGEPAGTRLRRALTPS
jgi:hypothetical protein